ncbi:MAG: exo-alpha-sialidase [Candidatus Hydrogenedentes bacterium]|nr:exo-alpha-sialidase [Candidatus Hydrogenedentota bacterium]
MIRTRGGGFLIGLLAAGFLCWAAPGQEPDREGGLVEDDALGFEVRLDTVLKHDDGEFLWFHPRVAAIPGAGRDGQAAVIMTLQKHLHISDYYSGLSYMRTDDLGVSWSGPTLPPELDWVDESDTVKVSVCDVTPGWHAPTGKLLAIGVKVRYRDGHQLLDEPRSHDAAYAVYDPAANSWTSWRMLDAPHREGKFYLVTPGCTQWIVEPDGTILLPVYCGDGSGGPFVTTVFRCAFDGTTLRYLEHGDEIALNVARGICEPSLVAFGGNYYLTLRNDVKGYVAVGSDGLHYAPIRPWTFDDGAELGSYNTQQHWLAHSDGLFLVYTRRGADNDHVARHRAPLFMAQVDPEALCVIRDTERVLVPERGATLGNFGAAPINERESWVTVSEGMWGPARERGAEGCTFVARVIWTKPNRLARPPR